MLDTLEPGRLGASDRGRRRVGARARAHLVGVERYVLGQLGRRPKLLGAHREDHFPIPPPPPPTWPTRLVPTGRAAWWSRCRELIAVCGTTRPAPRGRVPPSRRLVRGMLVVRTFELWTHDDDIRRAVDLPPNVLDDERLALMSSDLMGVLTSAWRCRAPRSRVAPRRSTSPARVAAATSSRSLPTRWPGLPDITITDDHARPVPARVEPVVVVVARHRDRRRPLAARADARRRHRLRRRLTPSEIFPLRTTQNCVVLRGKRDVSVRCRGCWRRGGR